MKDIYLKLLMLAVSMNVMFGIGALGANAYENPLHIGGCYWDDSAAIAQTPDPVEYKGGGESLDDVVGELTYPTNSTNVTGGTTGDGNIFNSIQEATEATWKTLETAKNFLGGTYVIDVFQNLTTGCDVVYDENEPAGWTGGTYHGWYLTPSANTNPVMDAFLEGLSYMIAISVIITIIQIVRPFL